MSRQKFALVFRVSPFSTFAIGVVTALSVALWATHSAAYEFYSDDINDQGMCADCHGAFSDSPYIPPSGSGSWFDDLHDVHRRDMLSGDCDTCHDGMTTSGRDVRLNSSAGGTGLDPISCIGCHGRVEDTGTSPDDCAFGGAFAGERCGDGAGLRQHHFNAGIEDCDDCHDLDSDPANFTPVDESVPPPYYSANDPNFPDMPSDPCSPAADGFPENYDPSSTLGLDNDGDGDYDELDGACAAVTPTPTATPTATPTDDPSATATATPTATPTDDPSATATATPSATPTADPSATATATATPTPTPSANPSATPIPAPLTRTQQVCVNEMNKNGERVNRAQLKENERCLKDFQRYKLVAPMTFDTCLIADRRGKVKKAEETTEMSEGRKCNRLSEPPRFAYTDSVTVNTAAKKGALALTSAIFGDPPVSDDLVTKTGDRDTAKCQFEMLKRAYRLESIVMREINKAKRKAIRDKTVGSEAALEAKLQAVFSSNDRIENAEDRLVKRVDNKCAALPDPDTIFPGYDCGKQDPDLSEVEACVIAAARCEACLKINAFDGLDLDCDEADDQDDGNGSCS